MAADNRTLGRFVLDGIAPAPRGMPQIEVSFDIDANGILSVKAHDKGTGREQKITITASSGLSKEEVAKMQQDAEAHAAEDTKRREEVEAKNNADNMAYSAEKTLRDNKEKIEADLIVEVENKVAAVREVLKGSDVEAIKQATQELSDTLQKVGSAIYSQQQQEQQQPPPPPEGGTEGGAEGDTEGGEKPPQGEEGEGTVEGEFREV